MDKALHNRTWFLLAFFGILLGLMLLSSGVSNIHFEAGKSFRLAQENTDLIKPVETIFGDIKDIPIPQFIFAWFCVLLFTLLLGLILSPELRKYFLRIIPRILITVLVVYLFIKIYGSELLKRMGVGPNLNALPDLQTQVPLATFSPPPISSFTTFLVSLAIILVVVIPLLWLFSKWRGHSFGDGNEDQRRDIFDATQASLQKLNSGGQWEEVILEYYSRMLDVIAVNRGLLRNRAVTPSEFAEYLGAVGLPAAPIRRLTHLFEAARYGAGCSNDMDIDIKEASSCLDEILQACGESV